MPQHVAESGYPGPRATYDDLLRVPDHLAAEIIDGVLYTSRRGAPRHACARTRVVMALGPFSHSSNVPGGWQILHQPEIHFGADVLVPDVAGWRRERMPHVPALPFVTLAPDWVCEVLSPSTEAMDRDRKLRIYAREGVAHVWIVDVLTRTLDVLVLKGGTWTLDSTHRARARVRAMPFEAIEFALADLWGAPGALAQ